MKQKDNLITDNQKLVNLFSTYFINFTDTLQLKYQTRNFNLSLKLFLFMRMMTALLKSKKIISFQKNFPSKRYHLMKLKKIIKSLNRKKSTISSCIPVSILNDSMDIYLPLVTDIINDFLKRGIFSDELRLA